MRLTILPFAVAIATLAGGIGAAPAQSPNSYPWCARVITKAASTSCYYGKRGKTRGGQGGLAWARTNWGSGEMMVAPGVVSRAPR
jgi:hypothetical protein